MDRELHNSLAPRPGMVFKLPLTIVSDVDIMRTLRELNKLDDFFVDAEARKGGQVGEPPMLTFSLNELARDNGENLLEAASRKLLSTKLEQIKNTAPLLHISFASEPSSKVLERILVWFRSNIHPHAMLQVGLQPAIAAGCILRSSNKVFDMSLGANLKNQEPYLVKLIDGAIREQR